MCKLKCAIWSLLYEKYEFAMLHNNNNKNNKNNNFCTVCTACKSAAHYSISYSWIKSDIILAIDCQKLLLSANYMFAYTVHTLYSQRVQAQTPCFLVLFILSIKEMEIHRESFLVCTSTYADWIKVAHGMARPSVSKKWDEKYLFSWNAYASDLVNIGGITHYYCTVQNSIPGRYANKRMYHTVGWLHVKTKTFQRPVVQ